MTAAKPRRFRLSFVNAAEDVPGLVRAYGRACEGEFALVLRPTEERGALVLVAKSGEAAMWRSESASDAPARPASTITSADAVALMKTEQKGLPRPGPITLRGQWRGTLECDEGEPRVELERKLATYGVLRITSRPGKGWSWKVERTQRWFSSVGSDSGVALTLIKAIEAGLARAMGLLGEACSVRDSRRRAALDEDYATAHPVRAAKEGKDPTERLKERKPRAPRAKAPAVDRVPKKATESASGHAARLLSEATARIGEGHHQVARELLREAGKVAATLSGAKAQRVHERVAYLEGKLASALTPEGWVPVHVGERARLGEVEGVVTQAPSGEYAATELVTFREDGKRRGRRVEGRGLVRVAAGSGVDAAKDRALLDAFGAAIAEAMGAHKL